MPDFAAYRGRRMAVGKHPYIIIRSCLINMSPFEYIMITGSIVLGLAMSQLLIGFSDSIRYKDKIIPYTPHTFWALTQLLACIQWGFGAWIYESRTQWKGYQLLLFICAPILSFLIARITYPNPINSMPLKEHYYRTRHLMFGIACAEMILVNISSTILSDGELLTIANGISVIIASLLALLTFVGNERLHYIVVFLLFGCVFLTAAATGVSQDLI